MNNEQNIDAPRLAVLGLGNLFQGDDGIGVRMIHDLFEDPPTDSTIELIDAGLAGLNLLNRFDEYSAILAIDAARMNLPPGSFRWITPNQIAQDLLKTFSLHDLGFAQTLTYAEKFFSRPAVVILAVQPESAEPADRLSPAVEQARPLLQAELRRAMDRWTAHYLAITEMLRTPGREDKDARFLAFLA